MIRNATLAATLACTLCPLGAVAQSDSATAATTQVTSAVPPIVAPQPQVHRTRPAPASIRPGPAAPGAVGPNAGDPAASAAPATVGADAQADELLARFHTRLQEMREYAIRTGDHRRLAMLERYAKALRVHQEQFRTHLRGNQSPAMDQGPRDGARVPGAADRLERLIKAASAQGGQRPSDLQARAWARAVEQARQRAAIDRDGSPRQARFDARGDQHPGFGRDAGRAAGHAWRGSAEGEGRGAHAPGAPKRHVYEYNLGSSGRPGNKSAKAKTGEAKDSKPAKTPSSSKKKSTPAKGKSKG